MHSLRSLSNELGVHYLQSDLALSSETLVYSVVSVLQSWRQPVEATSSAFFNLPNEVLRLVIEELADHGQYSDSNVELEALRATCRHEFHITEPALLEMDLDLLENGL
jgi:hypothetical protein